jgi:hypothetical protein
MESTIAVPSQHLPLPYVPELPAEFVRMLQPVGSMAQQGQSNGESKPN